MDTKRVTDIRRLHGTFTTIYTIIAAFWIGAPIFFVNYEAIFQSGLTNFFVATSILMLSSTIVGKEAIRNNTKREFMLTYRHTIGIIFFATAAIFASAFYIWNLITMLSKCDTVQTNTTIVSETISYTEDERFQDLRARKICRNEQGFAIGLSVLLLVMDLLNLAAIGFYLWVRSLI